MQSHIRSVEDLEFAREFAKIDAEVEAMIEAKKHEFSFHIKETLTYFPEID